MKYLITFCILISFSAFAQQEPITGMYWNNYSYYNPAMSGVKYKHEANATYRNQWDKVDGAPNSIFVNYGMNLADKHGLGGNYMYDEIGFSQTHRIKINYNYQLKFKNDQKLVFGVAACYSRYSTHGDWIFPTTPEPGFNETQNSFLANLGMAYYGKNITAGIGATQLPVYSVSNNSGFYTNAPHLFGNLRYELQLKPHTGFFIFETKIRTDFVKYSQDFNVGYNYRNIVEGGIGYRTSDAILFNLTGIIKGKYRVGYMYEMTINKLSSISRGTHEIAIGLRIPN